MIKINKAFSSGFIERYLDYAIHEVLIPKILKLISRAPLAEQVRLREVFSDQYLRELVLARPDKFEEIIKDIYTLFPELAERYCYSYILQFADLPQNSIQLDISSDAGKADFDNKIKKTISELTKLAGTNKAYLTLHYISIFGSSIARSKKRGYLVRLENAKRGKSQATDAIKKLFPDWVNEFEECFDYVLLSGAFGQALTEELAMTVCPYCSIESIQTYSSISVRPDLDHFYPKTRFPFLAISIFNLIPSGPICNQKHKRNNSMLGYMNPYIESIDENMFRFGFLPDGNIRETFSLSLEPLGSISRQKNIELFKLQRIYAENEDLRSWFFDTYELSDYIKGQGGDLGLIDFRSPPYRHVVDLARPVTKVSAQKFKIEAINLLFNTQLKTVPQSDN